MGSIIGSKSSHHDWQADELRDQRERYQKKIDDLIKNQNFQLAKLNKYYDRRITDLERQNQKILNRDREANQDAITRRDMEYQNEIDQLRKMHAKQVEKLRAENQDRLERARFEANEELRTNNMDQNNRLSELEQQYADQQAQQSQQFENNLNQIRASEKRAVDQTRKDLNTQHQKETEAIRMSRDQEVGQLQKENDELNRYYEMRLHDQKQHYQNNEDRIESHDMSMLQNKEEMQHAELARARDGFNQNLKTLRQRYDESLQNENEKLQGIDEQAHDRIEDRMNNELRDLKFELARAKQEKVLNNVNEEAQAQREIKNIENDYQQKYADLQRERVEALRDSNAINAANIRKIHEKDSQQMQIDERQVLSQSDLENEINQEALANQKQQSTLRNQYEQNLASERIKKIRQNAFETEKQLRKNYVANVQQERQAFQTKRRDLMLEMRKKSAAELRTVEEHAEHQEMRDQENLANLKEHYQNQINNLQDKLTLERQQDQIRDRRLVKEMKRESHQQLETQKIQYQDKMRLAELAHEREVHEIDRRNQEKLDQVLTTMKQEEKS